MDLDRMLALCRKCKYLPENELKQLCDRICDILMSESNIQPVRRSKAVSPELKKILCFFCEWMKMFLALREMKWF